VVLPKDLVKLVPKTHLMSDKEWRGIGVQQSEGWVHYMIHDPGQLIFEMTLEFGYIKNH
jgi:cyclin-dependent kinase regulatory subunit CKS1